MFVCLESGFNSYCNFFINKVWIKQNESESQFTKEVQRLPFAGDAVVSV